MTPIIVEADPVRAVTVWQPWADALAYLGKDIENRTRRTTYTDGGLLFIHAGLRVDEAAYELLPEAAELPGVRGAVIAVARLTGCHRCDGSCSDWAETGPDVWHWEISDVVPLETPVKATGQRNLWIPEAPLRARVSAARLAATPSPRRLVKGVHR